MHAKKAERGVKSLDISTMKADKVNVTYGFKIGSADAPVKVIEFLNLGCPFCKQWYVGSKELLTKYINENKVQRVIKLFDKEKPGLKKGNVLHHHLDYKQPEEAYRELDYFLTHQGEWKQLETYEEVAEYAIDKRGLKYQPNEIEINGIIKEAEEANVVFVPSVFIGEHIFDEHITNEELQQLIESELKRKKA